MFARIKAAAKVQAARENQLTSPPNFSNLWSKYNTVLDELGVKITIDNNLARASEQEQQALLEGRDFAAADWMAERLFYAAAADAIRQPPKAEPPVWR